MESYTIYEKHFLKDCLGKLKRLRLQWSSSQWDEEQIHEKSNIPTSMCNLGGNDYGQYSFIMRESSEYVYQAICRTLIDLARKYKLTHRHVICRRSNAYRYIDKNGDGPTTELDSSRTVHILYIENDGEKTIFVIKEIGIAERLPIGLEKYLKSAFQTPSLVYVSLVTRDAEKEDYSRKGDVIDVVKFLRDQFGSEEETRFFSYFEQLKTRANDIFGLKITKTLQYMELGAFRAELLKTVRERSYPINVAGRNLAEEQRVVIEKHYFEEGRCKATVGGSDFATSFITAEWLYSSLKGAANVDLSPVALGYFKALEQFLYLLIEVLAAHASDGARTLHVGPQKNNRVYWKIDGVTDYGKWIPVNEDCVTISPEIFAEGFQYIFDLGKLTSFFGRWNKKDKVIEPCNEDLLHLEIESETYEAIVLMLQNLRTMRNGYLHKDNLYEWSEVDKVRNEILTVFYLMLGSYRLNEQAMERLDVLGPERAGDFDRLCVYIDQAALKKLDPPGIPVFYFDHESNPWGFCLACPAEDDPTIDKLGRVVSYSAAYFRGLGTRNGYDLKVTMENVPSVISEGRLLFGTDDSGGIRFDVTGPEKVIFEAGQFTE